MCRCAASNRRSPIVEAAGNPPVFIIGDCHGHHDRLGALLAKADVDDLDCITVQLGDFGHWGHETLPGDLETLQRIKDGWVDVALWGNHDRAVVDYRHEFGGFNPPGPEARHMLRLLEAEGRLQMAYAAHGWLITHAGLHAQFKYQRVEIDKQDPQAIANWLNERGRGEETEPVIDAIGGRRGGWSPYGGILWRDQAEKLYAIPQVFGHSASQKHKVRGVKDTWWNIDVGGKGGRSDPSAECLAGIWLPSQEVVRVDMNGGDDADAKL